MSRALLVAALLGAAAAGCDHSPAIAQGDVPVAACGQAVGGPFALPVATAVEAAPGYDARLAAADLRALPAQLEVGDVPLVRALIGYMLEVDASALPPALSRDELLSGGPMGRAVALAFTAGPSADIVLLRQGLQRFYACTRRAPATLDAFGESVAELRDLPPYLEVDSSAKNTRRRLRALPSQGIWMAQTLVGDQIRETELILAGRRSDRALDFLAYDADGRLMDRSRFETEDGTDISGAAPYVCIICHSSGASFGADRIRPD